MPLPPDHQRQTHSGRPLSARERRLVRGVSVVVAVLVIAVVIALVSRGRSSGHGCVHATFPGPVGAVHVDRCGGPARTLCMTLGGRGGYTGEAERTIAAECRKAGLSVRS